MKQKTVGSGRFRVLDSHVNIGQGELEGDPIKSAITPDDIIRLMTESGIETSIVFPVSRPTGFAEANREVADCVKRYSDHFLGFGRIRSRPVARMQGSPSSQSSHRLLKLISPKQSTMNTLANRFPALRRRNPAQFDRAVRTELEKCFDEYGLRGIKVHPDEDGYPTKTVLDALQHYRKPILIHCGNGISLRRIEEEIIKPYTMPVILAHMGGFPAVRFMYLKAFEFAQRYPHVYLNTAYVFYRYVLERALSTCPSKVVFGSDAPGVHPSTAISAILALRVSDDTKQAVLRDNMLGLLGL